MTEATKKKHVVRELNDYYHLPDPGEEIVQVIRGCGNNLHEVQNSQGEQYLVSMPCKYRRSVWIKRGDFLIVTPIDEGNKVRAEINSILMKDHIKYLKELQQWPKEFEADESTKEDEIPLPPSDEESDDQDIEPNLNHMKPRFLHDDEEDEEDEEEDEEKSL